MKYRIILFFISLLLITTMLNAYGAVFLPSADFDDVDYLAVRDSLNAHSISFYVFSDTYDTLRGRHGERVIPYTVIDSVEVDSLEFIIMPGGTGTYYYIDNEKLLSLLKDADERGVILGSIGSSGILLIESGAAENEKISMQVNEKLYELTDDNNVKLTAYDSLVSNNLISSFMSKYRNSFIKTFLRVYDENSDSESQ